MQSQCGLFHFSLCQASLAKAPEVRPNPVAVMADWSIGRKAGPIRNQRMLDEHAPDLVVAFPGGRGTADMVRRARKSGVEVAKIGIQETR
jgi:hypothetical protein